jgi:predicted metal-binding membrane protein
LAWLILVCFYLFIDRRTVSGSFAGLSACGNMPMQMIPTESSLEPTAPYILHWILMVCAMMLPTLLGSLRLVAERSLWQRRNRAMILVLIGYGLPWLLLGTVSEILKSSTPVRFTSPLLIASLIIAAAWQFSPVKRRTLIRCHLEPLIPPVGCKADRGCVRYGFFLAIRCGASCWALMLACVMTEHALWAMALISIIIWIERSRPNWTLRMIPALAIAALAHCRRSPSSVAV